MAAWWHRAPELHRRALQQAPERGPARSYRFASGQLELDSDDEPLNRRFSEIYPEGEANGGAAPTTVRLRVRSAEDPSVAAVSFDDPETLDAARFCRELFPDRNYVAGPEGASGWQTLALASSPGEPILAMKGDDVLADRGKTWQPFVANVAVNRVLRLQRDMLFFHAATVAVAGRGLMFLGPKHSGKTTTSLTLASRGHGFLGDEIAGVRCDDRMLVPFRRAASIRSAGPRTERVSRRLDDGRYPEETFPDGSARVLANVADLFPEADAPSVRLSAVLFLRRFSDSPSIEPVAFGMEHVSLLTPLACSMWGVPAGMRVLRLGRLMRDIRCYYLDPGSPDETADLLEHLAKELPV